MLPDFEQDGTLPPGIHTCSWEEFSQRYGHNRTRKVILSGLVALLADLRDAGGIYIFVDGSFICNKSRPSDYDACVYILELKTESEIRQMLSDDSNIGFLQLKRRYGGDIRVDMTPVRGSISPYIEFFQRDERKLGKRKGLVRLKIQELNIGQL